MKYLKEFYKRYTLLVLDSWIIQLFLGVFFTIFLVAEILWGTQLKTWLQIEARFNSLLAMLSIYFLTYISLRRFSVYLGHLSLQYVMPILLLWTLLTFTCLLIFRLPYSVYFLAVSWCFTLLWFVVIIGMRNHYNRQVIAYVPEGEVNNLPMLPTVEWKEIVNQGAIDKQKVNIVMADLRADLSSEWEQFLARCTLQHIPVYHSGRLVELLSGRIKIDHLYENELGSLLPSKYYQVLKRALDISLILIGLPFILPIVLITSILILLESSGSVFFLQKRVGQGGKIFTMYKFRSMYQNSEEKGAQFAKEGDLRVTKIGQFIRKTRIDELPQLINVLLGDMSLIGPRPEQENFVKQFKKEIPFYNYRHIVKPGISGWAQVMHGYAANTDDTKIKLEYDFYYIKNFSFSLDLLVFFKTVHTIMTGFGAR